MKKILFLSAAIFLLIFTLGCIQTAQEPGQGQETVTLALKYFDKDNSLLLNKTLKIEKGTNAFEAMKKITAVESETFSFGVMVKSIAGIAPPEGYYLALYVDSNYAQKGISDYILEKDTLLEWKTEKIQDFGIQ